ncbi:alpha/beta fold hydrolase [Flindersiella endophytica]
MRLTVHNSGVDLAVQVRGTGRPVVLVHGHGTSLRSWDLLAARLEQQYTVVAYDRRGHGRSSSAGSFAIEAFAADLDAVVRRLELEAPLLIGHSVGAWDVLTYAASKPAAGVICLDHAIASRDPYWATVYGGPADGPRDPRTIEAGWTTVGDEPYDEIRCPLVIMLAEHNNGPVHDMLHRLVRRRGLRTVEVASDHDIQIEQPDVVSRMVGEVLG